LRRLLFWVIRGVATGHPLTFERNDMRRVESGDLVKICYTGRFENGEIFERATTCEAVEIRVGAGEIVPGLENALIGMAANEMKTVTLSPDEAYGERDERLEQTVLRSSFPPDLKPITGEFIAFRTPKGEQLPAMIKSVEGEKVTIDFNHPLAGKSLIYEVEVAEINDLPSSRPSECNTGRCCS